MAHTWAGSDDWPFWTQETCCEYSFVTRGFVVFCFGSSHPVLLGLPGSTLWPPPVTCHETSPFLSVLLGDVLHCSSLKVVGTCHNRLPQEASHCFLGNSFSASGGKNPAPARLMEQVLLSGLQPAELRILHSNGQALTGHLGCIRHWAEGLG